MKSVLFLGDGNHYFNRKLIEHLKKKDSNINVSFLSTYYPLENHPYDSLFNLPQCSRFRRGSKIRRVSTIINLLQKIFVIRKHLRTKKFDFLHIQYIHSWIYLGIIGYKSNFDLITTVWGSDYYRVNSPIKKWLIGKILNSSKIITVASSDLKEELSKIVPKEKIRVIRFGLDLLEIIDQSEQNKFLKKNDSVNIVIGYNSHPAQQHLAIIHSIAQLPKKFLEKIEIIVPLTYGPKDKDYFSLIEKKLKKSGFKYKIISDFLSEKDLAQMKVECDIMLQLQISDQFSGSMQEHIYAGNLVITGSWLTYNDLINEDVFFYKIDSVTDLEFVLLELLETKGYQLSIRKIENNKTRITKLSSWKTNINKWYEIYN